MKPKSTQFYGTVYLRKTFSDILKTQEFNRLKGIRQGFINMIFGAKDTRYEHSLGTLKSLDLCLKGQVLAIHQALHNAGLENVVKKRTIGVNYINSLRFAALMHDIGHAPFSHTTEQYFDFDVMAEPHNKKTIDFLKTIANNCEFDPLFLIDLDRCLEDPKKRIQPHEVMSACVAINYIKNSYSFSEISSEFVARCILGVLYSDEKNGNFLNSFINLINSDEFDVDKMDYLIRSGTKIAKQCTKKHDYTDQYLDKKSIKSLRRIKLFDINYSGVQLRDSAIDNLKTKIKNSKSLEKPYIEKEKQVMLLLQEILDEIKAAYSSEFSKLFDIKSLAIRDHKIGRLTFASLKDSTLDNLFNILSSADERKINISKKYNHLVSEYNAFYNNWSFNF